MHITYTQHRYIDLGFVCAACVRACFLKNYVTTTARCSNVRFRMWWKHAWTHFGSRFVRNKIEGKKWVVRIIKLRSWELLRALGTLSATFYCLIVVLDWISLSLRWKKYSETLQIIWIKAVASQVFIIKSSFFSLSLSHTPTTSISVP